jgi:hypothetical protein
VGDELILKFEASMIATDMNAHAQFNHVEDERNEKPATLSRGGLFYPRRNYIFSLKELLAK